ncbi:Hpt domain-containing protein [Cerasicoccus frondis]|uniref:Hpt domain-containing protein n=1 Tax=Cerasicoccus frondis TaxID=490090 RepID=UPI002852C79D|nr:Hpt domain-containing protein [Cerasicoccus frondis]
MPDFEESIEPANVAVLDENYLRHWEISIGEEAMSAFIAELIAEFHATYTPRIQELQELCQSDAQDELIPLVHYLKGSLGNLGISRASAYARQVEVELRMGNFTRHENFAQRLDEHVQQGLRELGARYA